MSAVLERQETRGGKGDRRLGPKDLADRGGERVVDGRGGRAKSGRGGSLCADCSVGGMDMEETVGLLGNLRFRLFLL